MADSENLRQAVLRYAQRHKHKKVGRGECWDLAHLALTDGTQAKSAADYGSVTRTSDDRWGEAEVETSEGIAVSGTVTAYKPQPQ